MELVLYERVWLLLLLVFLASSTFMLLFGYEYFIEYPSPPTPPPPTPSTPNLSLALE